VRKVESGSGLVLTSNDVRSRVVGSFHKIGELIGDISGNSNEQAQGIEQLNVGVAEMDKVVQQNAANAEELAATSEEMNAQAEKMNRFAQELVRLVGKGRDQEERRYESLSQKPEGPVSESLKRPATDSAKMRGKPLTPEEIIPLDDNDFEDF